MMKKLIEIQHAGNHSLAVSNGKVTTFDGRGVSDLYRLLTENPGFLDGADIADKVVGKGAAAMVILGNAHALYADVISMPALQLLETSSVKFSYGKTTPNIINRAGNGICPVETLCLDCETAEECMPLISQFLSSLSN